MLPTLLGAALLPLLAAADEPRSAGIAPGLILARATKEGKLITQQTLPIPHPEERTRKVSVSGKVVTQRYQVTVITPETMTQSFDLARVKVIDTSGKKVDPKSLPRLLPKLTPVAIAIDSARAPIDPAFLSLLKKGTLVLLVPPPPPQALMPPPPPEKLKPPRE
jgi:hypothetical protein